MNRQILVLGVLMMFALVPVTAEAQFNNKPFSFKGTADGSVGISIGGQQALLNKKILGSIPDNLVRSSTGQLLSLSRGPNHSAIVSFEGDGGFIPSFRGTSFRGSNTDLSAGVFNAFFSPSNGGGTSSHTQANLLSGNLVNTWTARVANDGAPISFRPSNSVDAWTGMVMY